MNFGEEPLMVQRLAIIFFALWTLTFDSRYRSKKVASDSSWAIIDRIPNLTPHVQQGNLFKCLMASLLES